MERHPAVSMPTYDSATSQLNDWLGGARFRGAQEQPAGLGFTSLSGLPPHAGSNGLLGQGYLEAMLPGQGIGAPHTPYTALDASLTERQLADLYPGQLDLLSVPGLGHLDPFLGGYQEEPLFGSTSEGLQDGEDKPRSKMQEKNRRAQRRFRERQKTKFTELTGKVEELEGRLEELLSEKARLEDRTSILQRTLEMRRVSSAELDESAVSRLDSVELSDGTGNASPSAASQRAEPLSHSPTRRANSGSVPAQPAGGDDLADGSIRFFHDDLRLSLPCNGAHSLSPEALKNTSPQDIICLYEQYVDELRSCLELEAADQPLTPAAVRVVKLANEISTLLLRAWALNPISMRKLHQHLSQHAGEQGPDELRRIAAALRLSEEQRTKLAAVTKRFQAQRGVLVAQRQAIYARLQRPLDSGYTANECISEFLKARNILSALVHDAMNVLKMNLRQEHWESLSYSSTCTQLLTPWQMATLLVEFHPLWYDFLALVGALNEGASS